MKTYNYRKDDEWVESDYPPYNLQWQPKARKPISFRRMIGWLCFWMLLLELLLLYWPGVL